MSNENGGTRIIVYILILAAVNLLSWIFNWPFFIY